MDFAFLFSLVVLLLSAVLSLVRGALGPTSLDRMVAVNTFTTQSILIISVYLISIGHPEFIDIALLYALIGYVGNLALVQYFEREWGRGDD